MTQQKTNYGNWIPMSLLRMLYSARQHSCCFSPLRLYGPDWWL